MRGGKNSGHRPERLSILVRQEISREIRDDLGDPRLAGLLTIARVIISPDLLRADVWVSAIGAEAPVPLQQDALHALRSASGYIRKTMSARLKLRRTPEIQFHLDTQGIEGDRVLALLDRLEEEES